MQGNHFERSVWSFEGNSVYGLGGVSIVVLGGKAEYRVKSSTSWESFSVTSPFTLALVRNTGGRSCCVLFKASAPALVGKTGGSSCACFTGVWSDCIKPLNMKCSSKIKKKNLGQNRTEVSVLCPCLLLLLFSWHSGYVTCLESQGWQVQSQAFTVCRMTL